MKKFFFIICVLVLLSGCAALKSKLPTTLPGLGSSKDTKTFTEPSGSILMNIFYPAEGGKVIKDLGFSPIIKVSNTGSSNVRGQACITGLDEYIFSGASACDCLTYSFLKVPDEVFQPVSLEYGPFSINPNEKAKGEFTLSALNRFSYTSKAMFKPCIKKDFIESCDVSGLTFVNGPVAITSFKEVLTPAPGGNVAMAFEVELKNAGSGTVIKEQEINKECFSGTVDLRKTKPQILGVIEGLPFVGNVQCKPASFDKEGIAKMQCVVGQLDLFDASGSYRFSETSLTPARLTVSYAYQVIDTNKFTIGGSQFS